MNKANFRLGPFHITHSLIFICWLSTAKPRLDLTCSHQSSRPQIILKPGSTLVMCLIVATIPSDYMIMCWLYLISIKVHFFLPLMIRDTIKSWKCNLLFWHRFQSYRCTERFTLMESIADQYGYYLKQTTSLINIRTTDSALAPALPPSAKTVCMCVCVCCRAAIWTII